MGLWVMVSRWSLVLLEEVVLYVGVTGMVRLIVPQGLYLHTSTRFSMSLNCARTSWHTSNKLSWHQRLGTHPLVPSCLVLAQKLELEKGLQGRICGTCRSGSLHAQIHEETCLTVALTHMGQALGSTSNSRHQEGLSPVHPPSCLSAASSLDSSSP